jgi:hypothetical protein
MELWAFPLIYIKKDRHFDNGNLSIFMDVEKGVIKAIRIYGELLWGWGDCEY